VTVRAALAEELQRPAELARREGAVVAAHKAFEGTVGVGEGADLEGGEGVAGVREGEVLERNAGIGRLQEVHVPGEIEQTLGQLEPRGLRVVR
jgi:hypothetical protein